MCQYDKIADSYDGLFKDAASIAENVEVGRMVDLSPDETVLDIGCGTGLFVEIAAVEPDRYIGIDPSRKMLERFRWKHKEFSGCLLNQPFDRDTRLPDVDLIVSLFGSPSYLSAAALQRIRRSDSRFFLMFYKPDYFPVTYRKTGVNFKHAIRTTDQLEAIFGAGTARDWHNFIIVENAKHI